MSHSILTLNNTLSYEEKSFQYNQIAPFEGFGDSYLAANLGKETTLEDFHAKAGVTFDNSITGKLSGFIGYTDYNYGYNSALELDEGRITNRFKGNLIHAGAEYEKEYKGFQLYGKMGVNVSGDFDANYLLGRAAFNFNENNAVRASVKLHSTAPNFNFLLYQSDYVNYLSLIHI